MSGVSSTQLIPSGRRITWTSLRLIRISGSPTATNGCLLNEDAGCCMFPCGTLARICYPSHLHIHDPFSNQHIIQSSFPTSYAYISPKNRDGPNFVEQFECKSVWHHLIFREILILPLGNGTIDFVPYISASCALDFREWLGGEDVINDYCHRIALEGGRRLASILGTEIIDEAQGYEFTLNMVSYLPSCSLDTYRADSLVGECRYPVPA